MFKGCGKNEIGREKEGMSKLKGATIRTRIVFAYVDSAHAVKCGRFFRRQGWEVHLVAGGSRLYQFLQTLSPSVLVIDSVLVQNNDCEATRKWRRDQHTIKVILLARERNATTERLLGAWNAGVVFLRDEPIESLGAALLEQHRAQPLVLDS